MSRNGSDSDTLTCGQAWTRMMEADVDMLRGAGDGALAAHVRSCDRCGAMGRALVAGLDEIDGALAAWGDAGDPDVEATAALAAARDLSVEQVEAGSGASESIAGGRARARRGEAGGRGRGWRRLAWPPVAAAAVIATLVLVDRDRIDWQDVGETREAPSPRVAVHPPTDRNAAIMETANPSITIVWLYEEEGS